MFVELTLCRRPPSPAHDSPVDGIRILATLPGHWRKDLRQDRGSVVIRVRLDGPATGEQIRAEVARALADPAIGHWELVSCEALAEETREEGSP